MREEPPFRSGSPVTVSRHQHIRLHPAVWLTVGLASVAFSGMTGYNLGRDAERRVVPKAVQESPDGWRVIQFPDIGVQIELPEEPFRTYNLSDKVPPRKGWEGRYYVSFGKGLEAEVYAQTRHGGWSSLHGQSERLVEDFKRLKYGVSRLKYEPAWVSGKQAEKITMRLDYGGDKLDFLGYCILDGNTEWSISARYLVGTGLAAEDGRKRIMNSIKIGSWGHLP